MGAFSSTQFMAALPALVRPHLPPAWQGFRTTQRSWLCQFYWDDPRVHFEVWNLGAQRGALEIGLHFEHPERPLNRRWLAHFSRHMPMVKASLGVGWEAEMWDKGWAKVYELVPHAWLSAPGAPKVAARLARAIRLLYPLWLAAPSG